MINYFIISQECYHFAIAYNRYTAFRDPLAHEEVCHKKAIVTQAWMSLEMALNSSISRDIHLGSSCFRHERVSFVR